MEVELDYSEFQCFENLLVRNDIRNDMPIGPSPRTILAAYKRDMCVEVIPNLIHKIREV